MSKITRTLWQLTILTMKRFLQHLRVNILQTDLDDVKFLMKGKSTDIGRHRILQAKNFLVAVAHCMRAFVSHLSQMNIIEVITVI
jgi:hypothetical protein